MMTRCCLATFLFLVPAAFAQTGAGSITGSVMDLQQAAMAGVTVTATNLATNASHRTASSSAGAYNIPALEPGTYRLTAEIEGFKKTVREPVEVEASRAVVIDLELAVGSTKSEVTVTAGVPLVQQASSMVQYGVNTKALDELPLTNQGAMQVLTILPGVVGDPGSDVAGISTATNLPAPGSTVSISGGRLGTTQYQADGVSNNSSFFNRISLGYSTDAIEQVSVLVNSYSAEYGRVTGGIVNMTTKSGTNQLHGTVFSFTQNDVLNASPFANLYNFKGMTRYWRGGIDMGGPVSLPKLYHGKNRTFFFFNYEPARQYTQNSSYARTPTDAEKQGDFSHSIYNAGQNVPMTIFRQWEFNSSGTALTNKRIVLGANQAYPQWPGNIIPKQFISPIGQAIVKLMPEPNIPLNAAGQNYFSFRNVRNIDNRYMIKADQVITERNRLSFRFAQAPTQGVRGFSFGLIEQVPTAASTATNMVLTDTQILGNNKVNEFHVGFNRSNLANRQTDLQLSDNWFQKYGFPSALTKGFPSIALGNAPAYLNPGAQDAGSYQIDNFFQVNDIFNWTKGKHSLKLGFDFQAPQQNLVDYGSMQGTWNFAGALTGIGNANTATFPGLMVPNATTGDGVASLLLGFPNGVTMASAVVPYQYRWKYYAGFLQDDFKITPRLTVNLGVRYQVEVPRSEKNHNQGYWVNQPATNSQGIQVPGYIQMNGLGGALNTLWPTRYNNLEPRVGFAYRLPGWLKGFTALRGGYAITHEPTNGLFRIPIPDVAPKARSLVATGGRDGGYVQMDSNPLVVPNQNVVWPSDGKFVDYSNINTVYYLNQDVKIPYMQQWNLGMGFQFAGNYGLEVNYVGSKGTNLFGPSQLYNTIDTAQYTRQSLAGLNMADLFPNPAGLKDQRGNVIQVTRADLLRPDPTMGTLSDPLQQGYNSTYNALQVQLQKRFARGFQFNINYTFSKSLDNSSCEGQFCNDNISQFGIGAPQLYSGNRSLEKSISVYDTPHMFKYSYNWDLPIGRGKPILGSARGVLNQIVGNWKFAGVGTTQSGVAYQLNTNTTAGFPEDVGRLRPNQIPGVAPINPDWKANLNNISQVDHYINPAAFAPPARLTIGTLPRVVPWLRAPTWSSYNMSILKGFPIHEQVRVEFRAELYGALNHTYVQNFQNNQRTNLYQSLDYVRYVNPPVTAANILPNFANIALNVGGNRNIQLGLKLYF